MTTVAVIQARTGSTPPGKVMYPLAGTPVLTHVVERVAAADAVNRTVVATLTEPPDEVIDTVGQRYGRIHPDKPEAEGREERDACPATRGGRPTPGRSPNERTGSVATRERPGHTGHPRHCERPKGASKPFCDSRK